MSAVAVTPELKTLLRRLKLGRCLDTLPERLALAQTGGMGHAEFLELVLEGESYRPRQKPGVSNDDHPLDPAPAARRSSRRRR